MKSINQVFLLAACCTMLLTACNNADNASPTQAPMASAIANVSDADVTTHVKSALNNETGLAGLDITVITTKGDVRLTGVVSSQAQIDAAATRNTAEASALNIARAGIVTADPYDAATRLEDLQTRLQSLYLITSRLSRLSLTEYLR